MTQVVIQPASNKHSRNHFVDTVENPVEINKFKQLIGADFESLLLLSTKGKVPLWGVTPGKNGANLSKYGRLRVGDVVFFTRAKEVFATGEISYLFVNQKLARKIWGENPEGQTWENMYSLTNVQNHHISYSELRDAIGSKPGDNFIGFRPLDAMKSQKALDLLGLETYRWGIKVGEVLKKTEIHKKYGGSGQHGMTSCLNGTEFLVFHNEKKSREFGYDKWEGRQLDGTFWYTGQGVRGDQKLTRANKSLLEADLKGKPIRLFESVGTSTTYLGQYVLGEPKYEEELAPDEIGDERKVFVFRFVPIDAIDFVKEALTPGNLLAKTSNWMPPSTVESLAPKEVKERTAAQKIEHQLQGDFGNFCIRKGHPPKSLTLSSQSIKGSLKPDLYIPSVNWIVEAKASSSRNYVREAIGQVLDYVNFMKLAEQGSATPVILLPSRPSWDLCKLVEELGIQLFVKEEVGIFEKVNSDGSASKIEFIS